MSTGLIYDGVTGAANVVSVPDNLRSLSFLAQSIFAIVARAFGELAAIANLRGPIQNFLDLTSFVNFTTNLSGFFKGSKELAEGAPVDKKKSEAATPHSVLAQLGLVGLSISNMTLALHNLKLAALGERVLRIAGHACTISLLFFCVFDLIDTYKKDEARRIEACVALTEQLEWQKAETAAEKSVDEAPVYLPGGTTFEIFYKNGNKSIEIPATLSLAKTSEDYQKVKNYCTSMKNRCSAQINNPKIVATINKMFHIVTIAMLALSFVSGVSPLIMMGLSLASNSLDVAGAVARSWKVPEEPWLPNFT